MCGPILGIALSLAGSFLQAGMAAANAKTQAKIKEQQMKVEMENERIKSLSETNNRLEEAMRAEASNRAALSASGLDVNIAYEQAIEPYNKKVVNRDVRRQQYASDAKIANSKYNIKVAHAEAKATSRAAWAGAFADGFGAIGKAFA